MTYTPFAQKSFLSQLAREGFVLVDHPNQADLLVSRSFDDLLPVLQKDTSCQEALIWTHEPRFDTTFSKVQYLNNRAKVHIMNCYTKDVYGDNYRYCARYGKSLPAPNYQGFTREKGKKIATIASFKDLGALLRNNINIDLTALRNQIAMEGHQLGKVDIYGPGWPLGTALEDFRYHEDRRKKKIDTLKKYHFHLCFENTNIEYYCTEKIWECLAAGCLPIYYGNDTIYEDFPSGSFLDYRAFQSPKQLFAFIDNMEIQEYNRRLKLCLDTYSRILKQNGHKYSAQKQNSNIIYKLKAIWLNQPAQKHKVSEIYQSRLVWLREIQQEIVALQ
jgi:hypothetical protein